MVVEFSTNIYSGNMPKHTCEESDSIDTTVSQPPSYYTAFINMKTWNWSEVLTAAPLNAAGNVTDQTNEK